MNVTNERLSNEELVQIYATAREARLPVVWTEKKSLANFRDKITPEVVESIVSELQQYRAAAKKPIYQVWDWHWYDAEKYIYDEAEARGDECRVLYTTPQVTSVPVIPDGLHPATADLVLRFATALAEKLHKAEQKYGYADDWKKDGWSTQCQSHFLQHITKGDPRDVAAYCAFMWHHGWSTKPAAQAFDYRSILERIAVVLHGSVTDLALLPVTAQSVMNKVAAPVVQSEQRNYPVISDSSEDSKRLDWLDAQNKRLNEYYGTSYGWKFDANFQRNAMMLNDSNYPVMTVRQAIDEAMSNTAQLKEAQEVKK